MHFSSLNLAVESQTCLSNGLLDISISQTSQISQVPDWVPHFHLFPSSLAPPEVFSTSVNGTSILLVAQASLSRIIFGSFPTHLTSNSAKCPFGYTFKIYPESDFLPLSLLPPTWFSCFPNLLSPHFIGSEDYLSILLIDYISVTFLVHSRSSKSACLMK